MSLADYKNIVPDTPTILTTTRDGEYEYWIITENLRAVCQVMPGAKLSWGGVLCVFSVGPTPGEWQVEPVTNPGTWKPASMP